MANLEPRLDETGSFRRPPQVSTLSRILDSVMDAGRVMLNRRRGGPARADGNPVRMAEMCHALTRHLGEPSGLALASEILEAYEVLAPEARRRFFEILEAEFSSDPDKILQAAERYREQPDPERLDALGRAIESPRHKLFRRLNMAPGGTAALVRMRGQLLQCLEERAGLKVIDRDLRQLLIAWFNRGFLTLERINWDSSARVLEKIIRYEAVHQINGWDDLRARLREDRRLFAFFHPAMPDDPLIFVEIALTSASATAIQPLLDMGRNVSDSQPATTATFYSINNCHAGLQSISFGNFLIKQVTEELRVELPGIRRFETLSPIPGFRRWVNDALSDITSYPTLRDELRNVSNQLDDYPQTSAGDDEIRQACLRLCAHYLLNEKKRDGLPLDPVARFHLGNGAYLDRLNWEADRSPAGDHRSFGLMVNYVYEPGEIEKNHEAYFAEHLVAASAGVRKLLRA